MNLSRSRRNRSGCARGCSIPTTARRKSGVRKPRRSSAFHLFQRFQEFVHDRTPDRDAVTRTDQPVAFILERRQQAEIDATAGLAIGPIEPLRQVGWKEGVVLGVER